ncbi:MULTISPECIES: hypothetical protein [Streptomyces]|uniref:Uncharacterized protein n=1 Tax=Streptomyces rimosus subsp. rimosus (strain ATCC 10970 / DSM 40260 / JCM 4667 / NRRL 2234) TaxID=1265868 RepID=A0A8A1UFU0_STRR1|nr:MULTISPECIES: hypothetical protein [Streptomyces]MYT42204.1 hypothetical protein [Streptomyces sp. SID5471]QST78869.1 hypothetical protein SRIM_000540 [Streptomyces rimosus subsp. rimosus ATCC 10970]QTL91238.1 hypothetical protein FMM49_41035 [Streptomyces rimosus subsp. rimosus]
MPVLRTSPDRGKPTWRFYAPLLFPANGADSPQPCCITPCGSPPATGTSARALHADRTPVVGQRLGDQPSEAATVIDTLLDDLGATVNLREHFNASKGLVSLLNEEREQGTKLTRSTLLQARMRPPRTH